MFSKKDSNAYSCPYRAEDIRATVKARALEIRNAKADLAERIRKHPLGSCGMAAGVAFILGKLARRH